MDGKVMMLWLGEKGYLNSMQFDAGVGGGLLSGG